MTALQLVVVLAAAAAASVGAVSVDHSSSGVSLLRREDEAAASVGTKGGKGRLVDTKETTAPTPGKTKADITEVEVPVPAPCPPPPCAPPPCSDQAGQGPLPVFQWKSMKSPTVKPTESPTQTPPPTQTPTGPLIQNSFTLGFPEDASTWMCPKFESDPDVPGAIKDAINIVNNVSAGQHSVDVSISCTSVKKEGEPAKDFVMANVSYGVDGEAANKLWLLSNSQLGYVLNQEMKKINISMPSGATGHYPLKVIQIGAPPPNLQETNPTSVASVKKAAAAAGIVANITSNITSSSAPANCSDECKWPRCQSGSSDNGGQPLGGTEFKVCTFRCSAIAFPCVADRYCGSGSTYEGGDSVDCSGCGGGAAAKSGTDNSTDSNTTANGSTAANGSSAANDSAANSSPNGSSS